MPSPVLSYPQIEPASMRAREPQTEQQRLDSGHLPQVMEQPELALQDSEDSVSPDEFAVVQNAAPQQTNGYYDEATNTIYTPTSTIENLTPISGFSANSSWNA